MKRRKILLIRKRKKKNKFPLMEKVKSVWFLSLENMLCLVRVQGREWEGEREGREVTSPASLMVPVICVTHRTLRQYSFPGPIPSGPERLQQNTGKLSWLFILPKQLDHIKRQQFKDALSNQIIQCLQTNQGNEAGVWPVTTEGRCCMYKDPHATVLPIYRLLPLYNITFPKSPLKFTFKLTLLNQIQYIH